MTVCWLKWHALAAFHMYMDLFAKDLECMHANATCHDDLQVFKNH